MSAYGKAATRWNPDSSRYGALYQTYLDQHGHALGANVQLLSLEKGIESDLDLDPNPADLEGRVTHQGIEERNFHIFYRSQPTAAF